MRTVSKYSAKKSAPPSWRALCAASQAAGQSPGRVRPLLSSLRVAQLQLPTKAASAALASAADIGREPTGGPRSRLLKAALCTSGTGGGLTIGLGGFTGSGVLAQPARAAKAAIAIPFNALRIAIPFSPPKARGARRILPRESLSPRRFLPVASQARRHGHCAQRSRCRGFLPHRPANRR